MNNECVFSPDEKYRYTLIHYPNPLFQGDKLLMWIGLNPSTADRTQLDPTLKRILGYTLREGYDGFLMTNLFAWRATHPKDMMGTLNPVGIDNDKWLLESARRCHKVVAAWGSHGSFMGRDAKVCELLSGFDMLCLSQNEDGSPGHPLYLKRTLPFVPFTGGRRRSPDT
jgi:hypothetical protein